MVKRDKKLSLFFYPDIYNKLYIMIKQTWEISNEERNRILSLHESATKNLYLMSEQGDESVLYDGGASTIYDQDENYKYYISQPNYSDIGDYLDWNRKYYVLATNSNGTSFKCNFSKDEKGFPMDIKVLVDKPLPILSADPSRNQFQLGLLKLSKKNWDYTRGNEITKNAYIEEETTKGAMDTQLPTGNEIYAVFFERAGRPTTVVVAEENSGRFKADYDINFLELKIGSTTLFNPWTEGFYIPGREKIIMRFSLYLPTQHNSYPLRPDFFKDPTPSKKPEFEEIKLDIQSPFEFDKITLTPEAEIEFKKFIEKVKSNYQGVSGSVEVIASASIDGDEDQKRDYNQKLSDNRANTIANRLKTETGISTLNFIPKGIGQTDQFAKGMKYPEVKDVNQTAPNRRLIIKMPTLTKEKQK
jgi:outer membrane protein OmpA-like peptidoglycan-associated protein